LQNSYLGIYREEHLFALKQAVELYDIYQVKRKDCDDEIEKQLKQLVGNDHLDNFPRKNGNKKNKNAMLFNTAQYLRDLCGIDLTKIDGLDEQSVLKTLSETGTDMTKWNTAKHFVSWMGLSPNNKISGGKVLSSQTIRTRNRAKQVFKIAAWGLSRSQSGLGAYYRRLRARLGSPKAINATARKIAVIFYTMLRYKTEYIVQSQEEYEEVHKARFIKNLKQKAQQFGLELVIAKENVT